MILYKNLIKIFLVILIFSFGLNKELNIDSSSSLSSSSTESLLIKEQQNLQEQHIKQQLQHKLQQYNLSTIILTPFTTTTTTTNPSTLTNNTTTTDAAPFITTLVDDTETDVNDLFFLNESRDSRSLYRQFFINNQQGSNVIRPKDYSYRNNNNNNNRYNILNDSIKDGNNNGVNNGGNFRSSVDECKTNSGNIGLCTRRIECSRNGGSASGYCGTFGVCCEMSLQCSGVSKLKKTIIRNPKILPHHCAYHIQSYSSNVCQLRIDFDMVLAQPTLPDEINLMQSVSCLQDEFRVGNIVICGVNTKQHIYVPFSAANEITDITIEFKLADRLHGTTLAHPFWNIIVTQLECSPSSSSSLFSSLISSSKPVQYQQQQQKQYQEQQQSSFSSIFPQHTNLQDLKTLFSKPNYNADVDLLAPYGCLQYFTERQGTFESFNYNMGKGPYMSNMRYGICFKRTALDTGVQLTASTFEMGAATDINNFVDGDCHESIETEGRSNDFLSIPESILNSDPLLYGTHYCGTSLKDSVLHAPPGPFAIYFKSDDTFSTVVPELGFKINYLIQ